MTKKLPPLPEPYTRQWINAPFTERLLFTADQMRAYALQAIAARGDAPMTIVMSPQTLRQAVVQSQAELWCDNCPTEDACQLRGQCAHKMRESEAAARADAPQAPAPRQPLSDDSILVNGVAREPLSQLKDCVSIFTAGVRFAERMHGITEDTCLKT